MDISEILTGENLDGLFSFFFAFALNGYWAPICFFPHLVKQMQDIILVSAFTSKLFILPSGKLT